MPDAPPPALSTAMVRAIGALAAFIGVGLVVVSLVLAMHFEATPRALEDAALGQRVGVTAGLGVVLGGAAAVLARRRHAAAAAIAAAFLVAAAAVLLVVR